MKLLAKPLIAGLRWTLGDDRQAVLRADSVRSLLLVELTRLGDAVTLLYLIQALRDALPGTSLEVLVDRPFVQLLEHLRPGVGFHGIDHPDRPWGVLNAMAAARRLKPDLALSVSPAYRNAAVVLASGSPLKAGYLRTGGSAAPSLTANPVEGIGYVAPGGIVYEREGWLERRWKLLDVLGIRNGTAPGTFSLRPQIRLEGLKRLRERGILNGRPHIVVHPFSSWGFRSWSASRYASLIERIVADLDHHVVVLAGRHEEAGLRLFADRFGSSGRVSCLAAETLLDSAVLIGTANLFVGNDSGPLHLACALGTPGVGVYGPSDPRHTAPPGAHVIYHKVDCSPCGQRHCIRQHDPCLAGISVEEVMASLTEILSGGSFPKEA